MAVSAIALKFSLLERWYWLSMDNLRSMNVIRYVRKIRADIWKSDSSLFISREYFWQLLIMVALLYLLLYPYAGLVHDARLYTLQALSHSSPQMYGNDIFLRYGSQDRYTLFTPLYSALGAVIGIEQAAAILTFVCQIAFAIAIWLLARIIFLSPFVAMYSLAFVFLIQGYYGASHIFACFETFITPRLPAEALVLFGIIACLLNRGLLSLMLILLAFVVHPLMALPGMVFVFILMNFARFRLLLTIMLGCFALVIAFFSLTSYGAVMQFDSHWLALVQERSPFLFVTNWESSDWAAATVSVVTLIIGALFLPTHQQRCFVTAALATGLAGLALTLVGCDWLHIVIVTQGQSWRWFWFATVIAMMFLPYIILVLWKQGVPAQTTCLLLVAAWLLKNEGFAIGIAVLALLSAFSTKKYYRNNNYWQLFNRGSGLLLGLALVWLIAVDLLFAGKLYQATHGSLWMDMLRGACLDGVIPFSVLVVGAGIAGVKIRSIRIGYFMLISGCLLIAATQAWRNWSYLTYPLTEVEAFATWRDIIPVGQEVLWAESPMNVWLLLQRPSYMSEAQAAGIVFFEAGAFEMERRSMELWKFYPDDQFLNWRQKSAQKPIPLDQVCKHSKVKYFVSGKLGLKPLASMPLHSAFLGLHLYRCG